MIFVSLIGIITSAALVYKIDFYIILLILATCAVEAVVLHLINKAGLKTRDKESNIITKFNYFYKQSKTQMPAKI